MIGALTQFTVKTHGLAEPSSNGIRLGNTYHGMKEEMTLGPVTGRAESRPVSLGKIGIVEDGMKTTNGAIPDGGSILHRKNSQFLFEKLCQLRLRLSIPLRECRQPISRLSSVRRPSDRLSLMDTMWMENMVKIICPLL